MDRTTRLFLVIGALSAAAAVMAGAFGAHAIAGTVTPERLTTFRTAAQYQLIHSVALVLIALLVDRFPLTSIVWAGRLLAAGIVLFSGSLYALVLTDVSALGAITPFGGLAFIGGWMLLAIGGWNAMRSA